jgi:hypothetical protein
MVLKNHCPHRPINFPDLPQPPAVEPAKVLSIFVAKPSEILEWIAAAIDTRVGFHSMIVQLRCHPGSIDCVSGTEGFGVSCPG